MLGDEILGRGPPAGGGRGASEPKVTGRAGGRATRLQGVQRVAAAVPSGRLPPACLAASAAAR